MLEENLLFTVMHFLSTLNLRHHDASFIKLLSSKKSTTMETWASVKRAAQRNSRANQRTNQRANKELTNGLTKGIPLEKKGA